MRPLKETFANSADPDQMPQNAASDQGLQCLHEVQKCLPNIVQNNLSGSNTDGSFTVDDSNSFFSPYKILPIAQENKDLGIFFLTFIMELYVVCTH